MYNLLPFILIILSLAVIIFIIIRKFPQLSLLDIENIPEVQEEKKKDEILKKKVAEKAKVSGEKRKNLFQPFIQKLKEIQLDFRKYVGRIERAVLEKEQEELAAKPAAERRKDLKKLLDQGDHALEQEDLDTAEQKYITAVRLDPKSSSAYFGLGKVYFEQGQLDEAVETFEFLLQIDKGNDKAMIKLAEIAEKKGDIKTAVDYYQKALLINDSNAADFIKLAELLKKIDQNETALEAVSQAVDLEPQNPKYLDNLAETAIMVGNKKLAQDAYYKLRMVNPDNQKLASLKQRIEEI